MLVAQVRGAQAAALRCRAVSRTSEAHVRSAMRLCGSLLEEGLQLQLGAQRPGPASGPAASTAAPAGAGASAGRARQGQAQAWNTTGAAEAAPQPCGTGVLDLSALQRVQGEVDSALERSTSGSGASGVCCMCSGAAWHASAWRGLGALCRRGAVRCATAWRLESALRYCRTSAAGLCWPHLHALPCSDGCSRFTHACLSSPHVSHRSLARAFPCACRAARPTACAMNAAYCLRAAGTARASDPGDTPSSSVTVSGCGTLAGRLGSARSAVRQLVRQAAGQLHTWQQLQSSLAAQVGCFIGSAPPRRRLPCLRSHPRTPCTLPDDLLLFPGSGLADCSISRFGVLGACHISRTCHMGVCASVRPLAPACTPLQATCCRSRSALPDSPLAALGVNAAGLPPPKDHAAAAAD